MLFPPKLLFAYNVLLGDRSKVIVTDKAVHILSDHGLQTLNPETGQLTETNFFK